MKVKVNTLRDSLPTIDVDVFYKAAADTLLHDQEVSFVVRDQQYYLIRDNKLYLALGPIGIVAVGKDLRSFLNDFLQAVIPLSPSALISYGKCSISLHVPVPDEHKLKTVHLQFPEQAFPATLPYTPHPSLRDVFGATLTVYPYGSDREGILVRLDGTEHQLPPIVIARLREDERLIREHRMGGSHE